MKLEYKYEKEAIKLANDHGYSGEIEFEYYWECIYTDPLFWEALGEALSWHKAKGSMSFALNEIAGIPAWQTYAHDYFDLVLNQKDTEKFWQDLLNPNRE